MATIKIQYHFKFSDDQKTAFLLELDPESLELYTPKQKSFPDWVKLDFHQCPNCPLNKNTSPNCPLAEKLVPIVGRFDQVMSYDEVELDVILQERTIAQKTSAQKGISSLIGLVMAGSGCPHTKYFKPMARFHLPLASEEETIYRATATYLLAQYFLMQAGDDIDFEFAGLKEIYDEIQTINLGIVERLRGATETDSSVNAVIILDTYAKAMPFVIEESLEEIRYLFNAYL